MKRIAPLCAVFLAICLSLPGYKYTEFQDLDSLMKRSDFIVVARVASFGQDRDKDGNPYWDGLVRYEVIVMHNVRGSLPLDRHAVILQSDFIHKYHTFRPGSMALLFLTGQSSIGGKKVLMNWADSGSIMPASPDLDVSKLKGLSEKDQFSCVLQDYVRFKERELRELRRDISEVK